MTGESPQSCSYHLRALAKYGFVQETESDDARETRWVLRAQDIRFSTTGSPEVQIAATLLQSRVLERDERIVADYLQHEDEFSDAWREAATFGSGTVVVTDEELVQLGRAMAELLRPYQPRRRRDVPADATRVHVVYRAVPRVGR